MVQIKFPFQTHRFFMNMYIYIYIYIYIYAYTRVFCNATTCSHSWLHINIYGYAWKSYVQETHREIHNRETHREIHQRETHREIYDRETHDGEINHREIHDREIYD